MPGKLFSFLFLLWISVNFAAAQKNDEQKFTSIGDFKLENGD